MRLFASYIRTLYVTVNNFFPSFLIIYMNSAITAENSLNEYLFHTSTPQHYSNLPTKLLSSSVHDAARFLEHCALEAVNWDMSCSTVSDVISDRWSILAGTGVLSALCGSVKVNTYSTLHYSDVIMADPVVVAVVSYPYLTWYSSLPHDNCQPLLSCQNWTVNWLLVNFRTTFNLVFLTDTTTLCWTLHSTNQIFLDVRQNLVLDHFVTTWLLVRNGLPLNIKLPPLYNKRSK